jgi:serine/threonine protein kinase
LSQAEIAPGTLIDDRYSIQGVLGQGRFTRTYLAADNQRFGDLCVLKEFIPGSADALNNPKARSLFEREAKVLYQINHSQIPRFLAWLPQAGRLFIVQEFIQGQTYLEILQNRQTLAQGFSVPEIMHLLQGILPVLRYLHERNILHRDISPANIMLSENQARGPILIDFGSVKQTISQIWGAETTHGVQSNGESSWLGTSGYAPPEQQWQGQCYPSSDLYALGVSAIVLLTGQEPQQLKDANFLEWQWHEAVNLPTHLTQVLDKMLAAQHRDRYQSAAEVLADLQSGARHAVELNEEGAELIDGQLDRDHAREAQQMAELDQMEDFLQHQTDVLQRQPVVEPAGAQPDLTAYVEARGSASSSDSVPSSVLSSVPSSVPSSQPAAHRLTPALITHCRIELTALIGAIAASIVEETLTKSPNLSPWQFIEILAAHISDTEQADSFRNRIQTSVQECIQFPVESAEPDHNWGQENAQLPAIPTMIENATTAQPISQQIEPDAIAKIPTLCLVHMSGQKFYFPGEAGYLGRHSEQTIQEPILDLTGIPDEKVLSRLHARVYWDRLQQAYMLVDNNSRNGTYLNSELLTPTEPYRLSPGDALQLGKNGLVCFTINVIQ